MVFKVEVDSFTNLIMEDYMKIESIEISNFKSIGVNPPLKLHINDINFLTGINDAGKTSILSASYIGFYNSMYPSGWNIKEEISELLVGSKHYIGFEEGEGSQEVILGFKFSETEVSLILDSIEKDGSLKFKLDILSYKHINIDPLRVRQFISEAIVYLKVPLIPTGLNSFDDYVMLSKWIEMSEEFFGHKNLDDFPMYLLEVINSITVFESSIKKMVPIFVPSVTRSERNLLSKNAVKEEETPDFSDIVSFFRAISSEKGRRNGDYSKFMSYCNILFPGLERIEINTPDGEGLQQDLFLTWKNNGREKYQPLSRSGGGIYNTIFLLARLMVNYNKLNIVIIDEPEIGLHPMLQQRFIKLIRKLSRDFPIQWILATHSPFILQNLKDNEKLFLIDHDGTQTHAKEVKIENKEEVFIKLGAYLPLSLSSRGVIFVEGQSEVTVLQILLNKVGFDFDKERLLIIPLGGENLFKIDPKDLKKLHEKCMVIIDSDLPKSVDEGGNIKQNKIDYGKLCEINKVKFVMHRDYRTLENLYPKEVLAKVLNKTVSEMNYGSFDKILDIPENNKVKIAEKVANEMTLDQAKAFPLVQEIQTWWS